MSEEHVLGNDYSNRLISGFQTAVIDKSVPSLQEFRPKLIINSPPKTKILTIIKEQFATCKSFDLSVAFISHSGLSVILQSLIDADNRGVKGRILTTDYLSFTEPSALKTLMGFKNIEVKIYQSEIDGPFHTKGYIFYKEDDRSIADFIIGSANITDAALTKTKEWNIQLSAQKNGELFEKITSEFNNSWDRTVVLDNFVLDAYERVYKFTHEPGYIRITKDGVQEDNDSSYYEESDIIEPNSMQKEALTSLNDLRKQGASRALVISATGTGKTYLCAFDVKSFEPKKCLFVVHRNRILEAAKSSFQKVIGSTDGNTYGVFDSNTKETENKYTFAMIQTLAKDYNLKKFSPEEFEYIVVDEAHHIQEEEKTSYKKILNYFKPKFILGLTATPERTDNYNIYSDFDNNIGYEIRLKEALNQGLLCPFHYFGVSEATINGSIVDDKTFINNLTTNDRVKHIYEKIKLYSMNRDDIHGLIFCSRVEEAAKLSDKLNELDSPEFRLRTLAISGDNNDQEREKAISRLELPRSDNDALDYIISVDVFNEGVDIPCVNQVIMLRNTTSVIVYTQQLGRGLRLYKNKKFLTVIDFIGNYKNNFMIPVALFGDMSYRKETLEKMMISSDSIIEGVSTVDFEPVAKELVYAAINKRQYSYLSFLKDEYTNLKNKIGHIPSLIEFVKNGSVSPLLLIDGGNYPRFLHRVDRDYSWEPNEKQNQSLLFGSKFLSRGLRPYEFTIIRNLINSKSTSIEEVINQTKEKYCYTPSPSSVHSAIDFLSNGFLQDSARNKYGNISYCSLNDSSINISKEFERLLNDIEFKNQFKQLIELAEYEYESRYSQNRQKTDLSLYEKYTRQEVLLLLNWKNDNSSTVYGYRVDKETHTCPIFVTYEKAENISESTKYRDRFINTCLFGWNTRSRVTLQSKEVLDIMSGNYRIPLFIKKSDDDGSEFYYMGDVLPQDNPKQEEIDGKPVVAINLAMEHEVPYAIYSYFTGTETSLLKENRIS